MRDLYRLNMAMTIMKAVVFVKLLIVIEFIHNLKKPLKIAVLLVKLLITKYSQNWYFFLNSKKWLNRIFAKPHHFIIYMFTGLSCPECTADLNCVRNRKCSPGEVCMVQNRPFNVNCVKVIYQRTRSGKKILPLTTLNKFSQYLFFRNKTALCRKMRLVLRSSVVKMTSVSLILYHKTAFANIKKEYKKILKLFLKHIDTFLIFVGIKVLKFKDRDRER